MNDIGEVVITLKPLPDTVPASARLRRAIKYLLRACRLRVTAVRHAEQAPGDRGAALDLQPGNGPLESK